MRLSNIVVSDIRASLRFDAKFHLSRINPLLQQLARGTWERATVAETFGKDNIWSGNIFTRVYATSPDCGKPLLVPYDLFRYVPWSDKILSRTQVRQFDRLQIKRGWMFIVCSGRNLGPVTIADSFCEQFTMSHDMVRIAVEPSDDLFYLAAVFSTAHGQALIRTDMNGSVIDHTDEDQIGAIRYPVVDAALRKWCAKRFRLGFEKRERARQLLAETQRAFLRHFGFDLATLSASERARRFSISRNSIKDRFDAEPFAPSHRAWRTRIREAGGCSLGEIAQVHKPYGRYKTNYVTDSRYGVRMMNGRQISQYRPIALQLMSPTALARPKSFLLSAGTTLLTADGRAEENLADCALVTKEREGWAASGHVHRVHPLTGVHAGLVYLACSCAPVQALLKAQATGSVVDGLSESDVASIPVPYDNGNGARKLGDEAVAAWELFCEASIAEGEAVSALESEFTGGTPA